jgi:hypothetical protein
MRGPLAARVFKEGIPFARRLVNTSARSKKLHPDLLKIETKYGERVTFPKSESTEESIKSKTRDFENIFYPCPNEHRIPLEEFLKSRQYAQSESYAFSTEGVDLSKSAGLPWMGPKAKVLEEISREADAIKADPKGRKRYPFAIGIRTQQPSKRGETKERVIFLDPGSEWYLETEATADAINKTADASVSSNNHLHKQFYCMPEILHKWLFRDGWQTCCVVDFTQFDAHVYGEDLDKVLEWIAHDYHARELGVIEHTLIAPMLTWFGRVDRGGGGMPSGKKFTNLADSIIGDWWYSEGIAAAKLDKFEDGVFTNGDDQGRLFSTVIRDSNVEKISRAIPMPMEPDKAWISNSSVWFGKVLYLEEAFMKSIMQVLNSIIFAEHTSDPAVGSKYYTAVIVAQQMEWLKDHPLGEEIGRFIKRMDKYPIEILPDEEVAAAIGVRLKHERWMRDTGQEVQLRTLPDKGFYAQL